MVTDHIKKLDESTVVLDVHFHTPGGSRKGNLNEITTTADKKKLSLSKRIMASPEYDKLIKILRDCRAWLKEHAVPAPVFRAGAYRIPMSQLDAAYEHVELKKAEYLAARDALLEVYPDLIEKDRADLKDQFNASDYPSPDKLKASVYVETSLIDYGVPNATKIGSHIWKMERAKAQKAAQAEADQCIYAMRASLLELLKTFAARLGTTETGKKSALQTTTYDHTVEFLKLFGERNVLGDAEAQQLADKAKELIDGADLDALRKNDDFRDAVREQTEAIVEKLGTLVETSRARAISFED